MSTEFQQLRRSERFKNAIESLDPEITIHELAHMLVHACEDVMAEGNDPIKDPAVVLITGRIGFASPADTMTSDLWNKLIRVCEQGVDATIEIKKTCLQ